MFVFYIAAVVVVPALVGLALRRARTTRWVVFVLWIGSILAVLASYDWDLRYFDSDDVTAEYLLLITVVTVLLPAELIAALAVAVGRRRWPVGPPSDQAEGLHSSTQ